MAKKLPAHRRQGSGRNEKSPPRKIKSAAVFERLRLTGMRLIDLKTHLEIHDRELPIEAKIESTVGVGPSADGKLHVNAVLNVEGRPANAKEGSSVVTIYIFYQCIYEVLKGKPEDFGKDDLKTIAESGLQVTWPFFRELVNSLTARMGIPFVMPMFATGNAVVGVPKFEEKPLLQQSP